MDKEEYLKLGKKCPKCNSSLITNDGMYAVSGKSYEDILLILQRAFAYEIKNHNWQCEFVEDGEDSFWEIGNYSIYKTSEGFHLTGWYHDGGSYWQPPDVCEYDISDEKDIWGVIKKILQCELDFRLDNTLPDIAEELTYKNDNSKEY